MPYVTSDMTAAMRTGVKALFMQGLGELSPVMSNYLKIATVMPSDGDKEEYDWLGASPPMNEWKDSRQLNGLRPYSYTLKNLSWESTLEIDRDAFNDNKLGHIPMRVRGLVRSYLKRLNEEVFGRLNGGAADTATFDGTAFFSDSRTIGASGTIDNLAAGAYAGSEANIRAGFAVALGLMENYCDDWGKPLGLTPDCIVCAPAMYLPLRQALLVPGVAGTVRPETEFLPNGIIKSPYLTSGATAGHDWYILCTTEEVKPIIFQDRQKPEVTSLDKPDDRDNFMAKKMYYGVDARFVTGFGDPRTCVMVDCSD